MARPANEVRQNFAYYRRMGILGPSAFFQIANALSKIGWASKQPGSGRKSGAEQGR